MGIDLDVFIRDDRALPELATVLARALDAGEPRPREDGFGFGVFWLLPYPKPLLDFAHYNAQIFVGRDILTPETFARCHELDVPLGVAHHLEQAYRAALVDVVARIASAGVEAIGVVGLEEVLAGELVKVPEYDALEALCFELRDHVHAGTLTRDVYAGVLERARHVTTNPRVLVEVRSYEHAAGVPGLGLPIA